MLQDYRKHVEERAAQGIPPKPLSAEQTSQLVQLLESPPAGEADFLLDLLMNRVPAGVDDAAYVKAGFLAAIAKGEAKCGLISREKAVEILGTMLGGYNIQPLVALLDDAALAPLAATQLKKTLLMYDAFHDVAESAKKGNAHAKAVVQSWADAEWFTNRPKLAEKITLTVFKVTGETNTDDLSPAGKTPGRAPTSRSTRSRCSRTRATAFYGSGKFAFGTKVTISDATPVFISGMGRGVTIFRQTSATEGGFKWANSTLYANGGLYACTVEAGAGLDASGYTGTGSTGTGLEAERVNDGYTARGVSIHNFARSLRVEGTWNSVFDDLRLLHAQEENILIGGDGAIAIAGGNKFTNIKASNNGFTGTNTASSGIRIRQSGGDFFSNIDCTSQANGVKIDPASGKQVAYCIFSAVLADTTVNDGWRIDGSAGAVVGCKATACWGSYATTGNGLYIDGANVDGFEFIGHSLRENGYRGAYVGASCRNITFVAPHVARNSKSSSNFYAGIEFAANASKAEIIGGRLGNFASGLGHEQAEGILIGTGATEITITGPDVNNPGTGKAGVVNNSTSSTIVVTGVRPIQLGYSKSVETTLNINSRGTIAAGSTVYLGSGASSAAEGDVRGMIGRSCVMTQVTIGVTVAPGSAKSFTYTVFKNGVATAMTGATTGAASYTLTLTGAVTFGPLDNFSIQLVTDAASGVSAHSAVAYFDR